MPKCRECGNRNPFLKLSKSGLCCACEIEGKLLDDPEFNISRMYSAYLPNNFIFFIALDEKYKRFAVCVQTVNSAYKLSYFNYADVIDFMVSKHESSVSKCSTVMVSLFLNSLQKTSVSFYLINSPTTIGSEPYNYAMQSMSDILGIFHYIRHNGN